MKNIKGNTNEPGYIDFSASTTRVYNKHKEIIPRTNTKCHVLGRINNRYLENDLISNRGKNDQDYVSITKSSVPTLNISRSNIDPHTCKTTTLATRAYCTPSIIVS